MILVIIMIMWLIYIPSLTTGIIGGASVAGPVGAAVGGVLGSFLGTTIGVAAGWIGADIRKTLSEHDVFASWKTDSKLNKEEKDAVEAENKHDLQNKIWWHCIYYLFSFK